MKEQQKVAQTYASTPYISRPFKISSPMRLEAISKLIGLETTPLAQSRVLEIGCSFGGNIIYLALCNKNASFVGIDISPEQITQGRAIASSVGADNLELICKDICDIISDENEIKRLGKFDYIIAHGVYSWVSDEVKNALFALGAKTLSDDGIMYVSYNTYPGWKQRDILRDLMLFSTSHLSKDDEKISRAKSVVRTLLRYAQGLNDDDIAKASFSAAFLDHAKDICETYDDFYLMHEHFERSNDPKYLHEFVAHAKKYNLSYLLDATLAPTFLSANNTICTAKSLDERIQSEQYADFLCMRPFRTSLLSHPQNAQKCLNALSGKFSSDALNSIFYRGKFHIENNEILNEDKSISLANSAIHIAKALNEFYPSFVSFATLKEKISKNSGEIIANLLQLVIIGAVEISAKELKNPAYKVGKTRLRPYLKDYLLYFISKQKPLIAPAGIMGEIMPPNSELDVHLSILFDGKNSLNFIAEKAQNLLNIDEKLAQKYTEQLAKILQKAGYFEEF